MVRQRTLSLQPSQKTCCPFCFASRPLGGFPRSILGLLVVTAVDSEEQKKIEHQIELATRAAAHLSDETTVRRLRKYAEELRQKLFQMVRRPKIRARAYELWTQAGQPPGRDIEFWLEAERQIKDERER
jgi:hypothetical protein